MLRHLITADDAFPVMEDLVLGAGSSLDVALHVFSPRTKTRSRRAHEKTIVDWGGLIADALRRGVEVRMLVNDFDPVGAADMHASVWERIALFGDALDGLPEAARARLHLLVATPGGQSGMVLRVAAWPKVRAMIRKAVEDFAGRGRALPPGLVDFRTGKAIRWWPPVRNDTQTLHQKFMIVDGRRAVIGGLDIDERRYDDPAHRRDAEKTWHDVSVVFDGPALRDLRAHFDRCWMAVQRHGHSYGARFRQMNPGFPVTPVETGRRRHGGGASSPPGGHGERTAGPGEPIRVAVTHARPGANPLRFGPRTDVRQLERAHLDLIKEARHLLYVETQFFRSSAIRNALLAALERNRGLHVIMLLPGAPDVIAYDGAATGTQRYGEWLQMRALNRLYAAYPERVGAFSLTNERDRAERHERDALHGKAMVYIHSKLMVADDAKAIVSSANLNARSMHWDVEAGIVVTDAAFAGSLRADLWQAHLGEAATGLDPVADPAACMTTWRAQARLRREAGRWTAKTGVVPFPLERTMRFAKRHLFLPEELV